MSYRDTSSNWRATIGNADALTPEVTAYLDMIASLVQDDRSYPHRTAALHTCASHGDPIVMLHHVRREGLCSTPGDHRLYDLAVATVRQHRQTLSGDAVNDSTERTPCLGCQEMEAYERMEQALFKLVGATGLERFTQKGWSLPVSEYRCKWNTTEACGAPGTTPCDHVYMHVKRAMKKGHDRSFDSVELNLNGAGLKLYVTMPRRSTIAGRGVTFAMRVGGDQVDNYPGFQAFAHQLFTEMGVPTRAA